MGRKHILKLAFLMASSMLIWAMPSFAQNQPESIESCRRLSDNEQRLLCYDAIGIARSEQSNWNVSVSSDEMTDQVQITISNVSEGSLSSTYGTPSDAILAIRCSNNQTEAFIITNLYLGVDDYYRLDTRLDDNPAVSSRWNGASGGRGVFARRPIPFIRELMDHQRLRVSFDNALERRGQVADFNLTGLVDEIVQIQEACHWQ